MDAFGRASHLMMASALVVASACSPALADCADVNAGVFDRTAYTPQGSGIIDTSTGFNVGDELTFVVSGLTGSSFELINGALNTALLDQPLAASPATLSYTVTGSNSDTTLNTYMLVQAIPFEMTIVATCVAGSGGAADSSQSAVRAFIASRIDAILLSDPSAMSLLGRSAGVVQGQASGTGAAGGADPFANFFGLGAGIGGQVQGGAGVLNYSAPPSTSVQFSQALSQLRAPGATSPWDLWIEGRYTAFGGDLARAGQVGVVHVGGDYRLDENLLVGVLGEFDWAKEESGTLGSKVEGYGWMVGPYVSASIADAIYLDLRAAWGRSSNELAIGGATGEFGTERWLVKGKLSGNLTDGPWRMTPSVDIAYVNETSDAFTDSGGTSVAAQVIALGRLQYGGEIGYRLSDTPDAFVEPFAGISGVWDFVSPNDSIVAGSAVGRGDLWGRLQGGLNLVTANGLSVRTAVSWDGLGAAGDQGYSLQGTVHAPLR